MSVPAKADPRMAAPLPEEPPAPRNRRRPRLAGRVLPPLVFSLVVLGACQAYTELADISLLLPSPLAVAQSVVDNAALFADNAVVTLQEILIGFVLGAAAGIGLAVLLTYSRLAERAVYPWLVASQMIPIVAVAPILAQIASQTEPAAGGQVDAGQPTKVLPTARSTTASCSLTRSRVGTRMPVGGGTTTGSAIERMFAFYRVSRQLPSASSPEISCQRDRPRLRVRSES